MVPMPCFNIGTHTDSRDFQVFLKKKEEGSLDQAAIQ